LPLLFLLNLNVAICSINLKAPRPMDMKSKPNFVFNLFRSFSRKELDQVKVTRLSRTIAWVLVVAILNLSYGCKYYYKVTTPKNPSVSSIEDLNAQKKMIFLHFEKKMWLFRSIKIDGNNITGTISESKPLTQFPPINLKPVKKPSNASADSSWVLTKYPVTDPSRHNRYLRNSRVDESWVLNEVHIHINQYNDLGNSRITFPYDAVTSIQVYDKDKGATAASWIFGFIIGTVGVLGILTLIIILTKESCPFVYAFDGAKYQFQGEIFSGSIYPQLERHDYMKLPIFDKKNNNYTLKITNEVREIQNTNLCELLVFDHPEGIDLLIDKYGQYHTISQPVSPSSATDLQGNNFMDLVKSKDSLRYFGQNAPTGAITQGIVMEFPKPQGSNVAKIVIRAKNTFFLDYMMGKFHDLFGKAYQSWNKKQKNVSEEKLRKWSMDQNIPLSLFVESKGEWKFVDYYHIAGPMALKDDILTLPLDASDNNPLRVKFEWGANFWEIDYAAVDFTKDIALNALKVSISTAITNTKKNVKGKLLKDDKKYYTQPNVGDEAVITFDMPALVDSHRSIILHTKGYYQLLRNPSGEPNVSYLKTFSQPGQFNRFCNQYIESIQKDSLQQ